MNKTMKNGLRRRQLIEQWPWLSGEDLELLHAQPWVEVFIEDDDVTLEPAIKRHKKALTAAKAELRARGEEPHERMVTRSGLETTSFVDDPVKGEIR